MLRSPLSAVLSLSVLRSSPVAAQIVDVSSEGRNLGQVHVPAGTIHTDHAAMRAQEPLIRPGTPDPYPPPKSHP
jgi:hypothetical protein